MLITEAERARQNRLLAEAIAEAMITRLKREGIIKK
jgi:hypothetical protein